MTRGPLYSPEYRKLAKSLAVALGSPTRAHQALTDQHAEDAAEESSTGLVQVPSVNTIKKWAHDPSIEVDYALIDEFHRGIRSSAINSAYRITEAAEKKVLEALEDSEGRYSSLDAKNYATVYGIAADKINGGPRSGIAVGPISVAGNAIITFAPAKMPEEEPPEAGSSRVIDQ